MAVSKDGLQYRSVIQGTRRCWRPRKVIPPGLLPVQLWVRIFAQNRTEERARYRGPRAFNGLCDDEGVPLIRPTCQVFAQSTSVPASACYFAWGCFRYFGWEHSYGEISCLKPPTLARPARGVQRRARSRLRGRAVLAGGLARPALCSRSGPIIEWQRRKRTVKRVPQAVTTGIPPPGSRRRSRASCGRQTSFHGSCRRRYGCAGRRARPVPHHG